MVAGLRVGTRRGVVQGDGGVVGLWGVAAVGGERPRRQEGEGSPCGEHQEEVHFPHQN